MRGQLGRISEKDGRTLLQNIILSFI